MATRQGLFTEPENVAGSVSGATGVQQQQAFTLVPWDSSIIELGHNITPKPLDYINMAFLRFEIPDIVRTEPMIDIAVGLVSNGVTGNDFGGPLFRGGWFNPMVPSIYAWQDAIGVAAWPNDIVVPMPEWDSGANVDLTVLQDSNYAFEIQSTLQTGTNSILNFGEGPVLGPRMLNEVSAPGGAGIGGGDGMMTQLQAYLDANYLSLLGHTKAGHIPALFGIWVHGNDLLYKYQECHSAKVLPKGYRPLLEIHHGINQAPQANLIGITPASPQLDGVVVTFRTAASDDLDQPSLLYDN
jgi:hypothetical protein